MFLQNVTGPDEQWPNNLADYIRHNDEFLMKSSEKLLGSYTEELLPCTSFSEFCDVTGKLTLHINELNEYKSLFQVYWMLFPILKIL